MDFDSMIKTEDTDIFYETWRDYRDNLTDYIISAVEDYYRKKKLKAIGKRQFFTAYDIEDICKEWMKTPSLAIWGAGGCNDIDIVRLSKYFNLVLIDYDIEKIEKTREKFEISSERCYCVDLKFWDITRDDFLMFEALVKDNAPLEDVEKFMEELIAHNKEFKYLDLPKFDFSVVVGLASQLNSRFASLAYIHNYQKDIFSMLNKLNICGVDNLTNAVNAMTDKLIIYGYETRVIYEAEFGAGKNLVEEMNEDLELALVGGHEEWIWNQVLEVAGNDILQKKVLQDIEAGVLSYVGGKYLLWNFTFEKNYIMTLRALQKKNL